MSCCFISKSILDSAIMPRRWRNFLPTETGLRGWACETRTQKRRRKLSLCKIAQISGDQAEFWPRRPFAFELRGQGDAARA
jgi:hypothetical protein